MESKYISKFINKKPFFKSCLSTIYKHENLIIKRTSKSHILYDNEHNILKDINNTNIIKLIDKYEDINNSYLFLPYYPYGDLYYNIANKIINIDTYDRFIHDLIEPVCYLHNNNIVHLDLKLENYLVNYTEDNIKQLILFDFNLAQRHNTDYYDFIETNYIYGTKHCIAPEVLDYKFSKASDIYSLGCMLYSTYTYEYYKDKLNYDLLKKNNVSQNITNIIHDCLKTNSKDRPTIFDIKHYYLT